MTSDPFTYRLEKPADASWIEATQAALFGPERFKRAGRYELHGILYLHATQKPSTMR